MWTCWKYLMHPLLLWQYTVNSEQDLPELFHNKIQQIPHCKALECGPTNVDRLMWTD